MKHSIKILFSIACLIMFFAVANFPQNIQGIKLSSEKEIKEDIALVPCKNKERLEGVKKLFKAKGAKESDLKLVDFKHVKNLVIEKAGKSKETIIIGAHYDATGGGCGAIDNWTGIVVIAHLYKTIKKLNTNKTYKFVAFGKEEQGLVGSRAMANSISKDERSNYCAMVNLDSFGMTYPQAMRRISDVRLLAFAEQTAKAMKMPFSVATLRGASSDSASFLNKKIPAISIHGLTGKWEQYLHSSRDKVKNVNSTSVYYGYRFALSFLAGIEEKPCDAFRKPPKKR